MPPRSLDSILSDEPSVHALPEAQESAPEPESDAVEAKDSGETPEPAEASAAPTETVDADDDEAGPDPDDLRADGLRKALRAVREEKRAERKRARELQSRLDHLAGQLAAMQRQPQPQVAPPAPQQKPPDDDEAFYAQGPAYVRRLLEEKVSSFEQQRVMERIEDSEAELLERHEDAAEHIAMFRQMAAQNPMLALEFRAVAEKKHPRYRNPAKFAYEYAKARKQAEEIGDPVTYREKLKAELQAELSGQVTSPKVPAKAPPKTIAGARGNGVSATQAWRGPRSLDEIIG